MHTIIDFLQKQPIGTYILTYYPKEKNINCYVATRSPDKEIKNEVKVLPERSPSTNTTNTIYDMYMAQKQSGKLSDEFCYILNECVSRPDFSHIPYTFPMKMGKKTKFARNHKNKRNKHCFQNYNEAACGDNQGQKNATAHNANNKDVVLEIDYGDL